MKLEDWMKKMYSCVAYPCTAERKPGSALCPDHKAKKDGTDGYVGYES